MNRIVHEDIKKHIWTALVHVGFLVACGFRVWMWTPWSLSTSRSTRPPRWGDARTVPTDASTPTWAPPATSRWSSPRRSRSFPSPKRRSPRRKRYEGNSDPRDYLICERCSDDFLGHLWMTHENKQLNSEQPCCVNSDVLCRRQHANSEFVLQVSQKKLKKQKLMARE